MRTRTLLIGSLALNVLLVALWLAARAQKPQPFPAAVEDGAVSSGEVRTNVVVRRQFFTWSELESENYPRYIENLRSINCPEQTVRDIIIADVNQLFQKRRGTELLPTSRQWWQSEADPALRQMAARQLGALERERRALLAGLLGPDWDSPANSLPTVALKLPLDGPVLGTLSKEVQDTIQTASGRAQRQFERLLAANPGNPDPAGLAAIQRQLTGELQPLLSPAQLEEFLLRFSPASQQLRSALGAVPLFNATPLETRTLFRNVQDIDLRLMSLTGEGPAVELQREALNRERQIAFQNALGPARYREYQRLQDPAYQRAIAEAQAAGVTSAADLFYAIDQLGAQEKAGIARDTSLTPLQQELALRKLELEQTQAAAEALGEAPPLPPDNPPAPPRRTYSFQKGDTIAGVSMQTGVPVALLLRANPDLRPEQIQPGTRIIIPEFTSPMQ
jgi:LysM repeat protein